MYRPVDITLYDLLYEDELYPVKRASGWNDSRSSLNMVELVESFHKKNILKILKDNQNIFTIDTLYLVLSHPQEK